MKALRCAYVVALLLAVLPARAAVSISSPNNNAVVGSTVLVTATAMTSTCSKGIASTGVYVDNGLQYVAVGNQVNTSVQLSSGKHTVVVQGWDYCNGSTTGAVAVTSSTTDAVAVTSPAVGSTVSSTVPFIASATSTCGLGVAAMGIYVNNQLIYAALGSTLNTTITLGGGSQTPVVQSWDYCGNSSKTPVQVNVAGTTISNIQDSPGWNQWGQLPPVYDICESTSVCPGVTWSMSQNQNSVALSGASAQFNLGGTTPYSDVLFSNPILGQGNLQGRTDSNHTLLPTLHDFTYETDVYVTNWSITQVLEFDINMYASGVGMEWGTECNHLNGNVWDYWDNVNAQWVHTSIPCTMQNGWNHVIMQAHRGANNDVTYQSIAVNGVVYPINVTVPPKSVPAGWWGMTLNYQMDGDYKQHAYTTYLDNFKFTYL